MDSLLGWAVESDVPLRLILSILLGGLIGLEREIKGRPAGLRTHVLVCLGATILLIAARSAADVFAAAGTEGRLVLDPNRISAGIVTGIGFLGAGAILRTGDWIRGLTTGATIWFAATLGIVIGNGFFALAVAATLVVLLVLEAFDRLAHHIPAVVYRVLRIRVGLADRHACETWCRTHLRTRKIRVQDVLCRIDVTQQSAELVFHIRTRPRLLGGDLLELIGRRPGVQEVALDEV